MTLLEIQKAAEGLSIEEKRDLMIFLLRGLRDHQGKLPPPRDIPRETIEKWIEDDESRYRFFLDSKLLESSENSIPSGLVSLFGFRHHQERSVAEKSLHPQR
jgi:hypothetical protein